MKSSVDSKWTTLIARLKEELASLPDGELQWLEERIAVISQLQLSLNALFEKAGGHDICARCSGECCGCGKHHITLTNLLAYLLVDGESPQPDFNQSCPWIGPEGCVLTVGRRPYNCITFFCEQLEGPLEQEDRKLLRQLDRELRQEYEAVAARYPAASLRGLWIALDMGGPGQIMRSKT